MELNVAFLVLARSGFEQVGQEVAGASAVLQGIKHNPAFTLGGTGPGRLLGVGPTSRELGRRQSW